MYKEFFGLKELPFSIAPDPRYLYMSGQHQEALAHLIYGINSDGGFVLLTGEVGTGKTTVCRCLLEQVPENTDIAFILNPKVTVEELLAAVCDELGIKYPGGTISNKVFIDHINAYLLDAYARGRKTVLIIEEAQNLSADVLEQVRLLTNLETNQRKLLQIIMLGQPELRDMLLKPELRQLAQRVTARYHLGTLPGEEISSYITHRLAIAGTRTKLFPDSTTDKLFKLSGGVPRLINVLCDRALLGAYVNGQERVDKKVLTKAAEEVLGKKPGLKFPSGNILKWAVAGLIIVCLFILTVFYAKYRPVAGLEKSIKDGTAQSRIPPDYKGAILPGHRGKIVEWLDNRMSLIKGVPVPSDPSGIYNDNLVNDVKKFQSAKGLVPDGIVGFRTMIYLVAEDGKGAADMQAGGKK